MAKKKELIVVNNNLQSPTVSFTPNFYKRTYQEYQRGDYRSLIALFDRAEIDSFIGGCMTARTAGYKKDWSINAASDNPQDMEIADFLTKIFDKVGIRDFFDQIVDAKMKIYSVTGIRWDLVDGKQVPVEFEYYDQKYFRFDPKDNLLKVDFGMELREIPRDSAIIVTSKKKPIFIKVLKDFIRKEFGEDNWSSFLEVFGEPFVLGTYNDEEKKAELEEAVNAVAASTRGVKPEGTTIEIMESKRGTGDHKNYVEDCKRGISFVLLGHEGASGNKAGAQIGENLETFKVKHEIAVSDMFFIQDHFNKLIEKIVHRNFNVKEMPKLSIDKSNAIDDGIRLEAARVAFEMGGILDPDFFTNYGIKLLNTDDLKKPDGVL